MPRLFLFTLALALTLSGAAKAGLHYSGEVVNPLPASFRGFLPDHRALRMLAAPLAPPSLVHDTYADALLKLETGGAVTPDQMADLGALYVRFGKPEKAVAVLRPAARMHPTHFRLAANLGTAWQQAGDLASAAAALADAVDLAPVALRPFEQAHLKLVRLRLKNPTATGPDELFGTAFAGPGEPPTPALPANAAAVVQQLALWLPGDGRLLWLLAEVANATGDVRTAANVLDGCITEFAMTGRDIRARRTLFRAAADRPDHDAVFKPTLAAKSPRPLARSFDATRLPAIDAAGITPLPWAVLGETTLGRKFAPQFLPWLQKLDGKRVAVVGFVRPTRNEPELSAFMLTEFPVGCWFCDAPDPAGMLGVELAAGKSLALTRAAVKVTGVLRLNRKDPEAYLFTLSAATAGPAD